MYPVYYNGERYIWIEPLARALHVRNSRISFLLEELKAGKEIVMHGHKLFLEEAVKDKVIAEVKKKRIIKYHKERTRRIRGTPLLKEGHITHWLGVYHG